MNNKEKLELNNNNYYLLKSFYLIRKNFPRLNAFYLLMILLKYFGILANSKIIEMVLAENNLSLNKFILNFFIFGKNFSLVNDKYKIIALTGAFILLFMNIFIVLSFLYMKARYKNVKTLYNEKFKKITAYIKFEEIIFKIISYYFLIIIFFHQYIIEYYSFGLYAFIYYKMGIISKVGKFPELYIDTLNNILYDYFQSNNYLLIFIVNFFVIIIIIVYFFIFMIFNTTKGLFLKNGISYSGNMLYLIMKIIILSFQPLFVLTNFYKENSKKNIGVIVNSFIIVLCLLSFWSCFHKFGYYPNYLTNFSLFIEFFVFVSAIAEFLLFFSGNKNDGIFLFVKIFVEIINTCFLIELFLYFKNKYNLYLFSDNLFSDKISETSKGGFYYYLKTYFDYRKDRTNNYQQIFNFILIHVINCNKLECPEHSIIPKLINNSKNTISISNINYDSEKKNENKEKAKVKENHIELKNNKKNEIKNYNDCKGIIVDEKNKFTDNHFQIIFEQEIITRIEYLYQSKNYKKLEDYIFIHLQYLITVKKNYSLALYYVGKYNSCGIKWSFMTKYYLYEYKKLITSSFYDKRNNNYDQSSNKHRKDNQFMKKIIDYFIFSSVLKNLVISSCSKLKIIFNLREDLHSSIIIRAYTHKRIKNFLTIGKSLLKNYNQILYLLRHDITKNNHKKISIELCYILSNFFIFIKGNIPIDLKHILHRVFDLISIADKLNAGYKFLNLVHPLLLSLTQNNTFKITYFSSVICNRFGYYVHELKFKDFHEKLFPGVQFIKQHELIMKQFLFFDYNYFSKQNTFLKTKNGNLINIKFTAKKFPTFFDDFIIIVGIDFIGEDEINKRKYHKFSFFLDNKFDFVSQTKNFYDEFEFDLPMYKHLKINFLQFFNINQKKFLDNLKNKYKHLFDNNKQLNIINLRKEDDAFIIFKNINYEKAFELRDISKLENSNSESIYLHDKIYKSKILKTLPELFKLIEECGLDFEWYQHIYNLSDRLSIKEYKRKIEKLTEESKNIVSLGYSIDSKNKIKYYSSINDKSSIIHNYSIKTVVSNINNSLINFNPNKSVVQHLSSLNLKNSNNNNDSNIKDENTSKIFTKIQSELLILENYFDVVYTIRRIGSINYYLVDLYEKILDIKKINGEEMNSKYKSSLSLRRYNDKLSFRYNEANDNNNNFCKFFRNRGNYGPYLLLFQQNSKLIINIE